MSSSHSATSNATAEHEPDPVEEIVPYIPLVLPLCGGVLIFLLALIAVVVA